MTIKIIHAVSPEQIESARALFIEYQAWLNVSLCFQGFDTELAELPGTYAPPKGRLYLAQAGDAIAGCIALRPMDQESVCEMKRLYVKENFRGHGIGRMLTHRVLTDAKKIGYRTMRLDTLQKMESARSLYAKIGFTVIPAYYENPMDNVVYMELSLAGT